VLHYDDYDDAGQLPPEHHWLLLPSVCRIEASPAVVNSNAQSSVALRRTGWGPQSLVTLALFVFVNGFSLGLPLSYALDNVPYWASDLPASKALSTTDV
jgi:hypothetical protein